MPEPGDLFAQRYRLDRVLARGGMGSVWVAHDERLARTVAVKFMDPSLAGSEELQARFKREASAAGALRTRHVVQVHDFGVEDDTPYIVMELLEGEDLAARLSRVRRLPLAEAVAIGAQIARGLRHAHDAGIVHRDLKPQNLFLCREDDAEVVKILDFGVAKRTGLGGPLGDATTTNQLLGSPQFMSPEQTRARGVDPRTDVWALGVILYRMLTGRLPFESEHMIDLMVRIQSEPHPPPSSIEPSLAPLDAFFDRALAKEADQRFASARELADELARITAAPRHAPVAAPPPSGVGLAAVPPPLHGATPVPTPFPSGASPLAPSMYGVSPPSVRPGVGAGAPRTNLPLALGVGGVALATVVVAIVGVVALSGDEKGTSATAATVAAAPPPASPRDVQAAVEAEGAPPPAAPSPPDGASAPSAAASASAAPDTTAAPDERAAPDASAAPPPTASAATPSPRAAAPAAPRSPAPRASGERKLLLTY
jgi:serine/threonine-protein kinase